MIPGKLIGERMQLIKSLYVGLAKRNYYTAKWRWKRGQRKALQAYKGSPVLNYQMGKVGSSTIHASLEALDLDQAIYHLHFLSPERVREIEQQRRRFFQTEKQGLLKRPWLSEFLLEEIKKKDRCWKLITLVREPIARNISTFFENVEVEERHGGEVFNVKSDYYGFDVEVGLDNVQPLIELFFERLVHDRPLTWFDDEIKPVFGLDVFEGVFPRDKGYKIITADNADLLLIRLNELDQCAAVAFKEFLAIDGFTLVQTNVASSKDYALLYKAFKKEIRLPEDYINRMYDSRFTRYFFSNEEIRQLRETWS
jgi:hypothetical protein